MAICELDAPGESGASGTRIDAGGDGLPFTELMLAIYPHLTGEQNTASFMRGLYERLS